MQFNVTINFWAVFVSALTGIVIGSIWYGPLFGKVFMKAMGMDLWTPEKQDLEKKQMPLAYIGQIAASLIMISVLAWLMSALGVKSALNGLQAALWVWFGFILPVQFGQQLWGGKMVLFWLGAGNMLLTLAAAGLILGGWR